MQEPTTVPVLDPEFMKFWLQDHRPTINHLHSISHVAVHYIWKAGQGNAQARIDLTTDRPLKDVATDELQLELTLRAGPSYQCQASDCRSMENSPALFDTCPACGRKGYLSGGFVRNPETGEWKAWEARTVAAYRELKKEAAALAVVG